MESKMMKAVKNMALGAVVGAAAIAAGAVYASESNMIQKKMESVKRNGKKMVQAGQDMMDDVMKKE